MKCLITHAGGKVVFCDIEPESYCIDVSLIEPLINEKTVGIIPVHIYGQPCEMKEIIQLAEKYNLWVIEDCAQAQGAKFKGKSVGSFGDVGCFSFYPTKILGAYGDGGFISTNSKKLNDNIKRIRFYGIEMNNKTNKFNNKYYSNNHGINSRINEIQCGILNIKLPKVNFWINQRRRLAKIYDNELRNSSLKLPFENKNNKHVFHLYVVYHPKRDEVIKRLKKYNIQVNINYPYPIHQMKGYRNKIKLPITEKMSKGIFSLPLYPNIETRNLIRVSKVLKKILNKI